MAADDNARVSLPSPEPSARETADYGKPTLASRAFALGALGTLIASGVWFISAMVGLFSDSWIAPINLSPDSDAVIQLDLSLTRQRAEMSRVQAEVTRMDEETRAIDTALLRLGALRERGGELYAYGVDISAEERQTLTRAVRDLREQRRVLSELLESQRADVARARQHLAGALIERRQLEAEEQALGRLQLSVLDNARALTEAEARLHRTRMSEDAFRGAREGTSAADAAGGRLPEIVQREEQTTRLELEIIRLEAERRALAATRRTAEESLASLRAVMEQIESRPLYRATRASMDVAFVPYEQLEGMREGDEIVQCEAGIFMCRVVGHVTEIVAGEVVTQDPWGELARGRYAVLDLSDAEAVRERILRVRSDG